ncbi:MAG TPA: hypothetical protein VK357_16055 [Rubrobacteraceae bacterium]|nr:hypothetical protein [Rubrobacteraceae bacterium]
MSWWSQLTRFGSALEVVYGTANSKPNMGIVREVWKGRGTDIAPRRS